FRSKVAPWGTRPGWGQNVRAGAVTTSAGRYLAPGQRLRASLVHAGLHPTAEELDPIVGPRLVARHRATFEDAEDLLGVLHDVVSRPEVELLAHRTTVSLAEERPYVVLEARSVNHFAHLDSLSCRLERGMPCSPVRTPATR